MLKQFPVSFIAVLAYGLPETSRSIRALSDVGIPTMESMLLALIFDYMQAFAAKDGQGFTSVYGLITGTDTDVGKSKSQSKTFESGKDFDNMRKELIKQTKTEEGD